MNKELHTMTEDGKCEIRIIGENETTKIFIDDELVCEEQYNFDASNCDDVEYFVGLADTLYDIE